MDFAGARLVRTLLVRRCAPSFLFRLHAIFCDGRPTVAAPPPWQPFAFAPWAPWLYGYRFFPFAAMLRALSLLIVTFDRICRLCVIALVLDSLLLSYSIVVLIPLAPVRAYVYSLGLTCIIPPVLSIHPIAHPHHRQPNPHPCSLVLALL